jgi:hypothetical protein
MHSRCAYLTRTTRCRDDQMQATDAALTREVQVLVRYFSTGS